MIVPPSVLHAVMRGEAGVVRLRATDGRPRWRPGQSVALRPSHREAARGRVVVVETVPDTMGSLTVAQSREEGWGGRHPMAALCRDWLARNDPSYRDALEHASDEEVMDRMRRHAGVPVWRVRVMPDPCAPPRLLAARSEHGYTASPRLALEDEPEAVEAWFQEAITREAHRRQEERMADDVSAIGDDISELRRLVSRIREDVQHEATPRTLQALRKAEAQLRRADAALRERGSQ